MPPPARGGGAEKHRRQPPVGSGNRCAGRARAIVSILGNTDPAPDAVRRSAQHPLLMRFPLTLYTLIPYTLICELARRLQWEGQHSKKKTTMKTSLKTLAILLGLTAASIAFASLVGIGSASAVFGYAMAGLMLMGVTDSSRPAAVRVHVGEPSRVTAGSRPAVACSVHQACPAA